MAGGYHDPARSRALVPDARSAGEQYLADRSIMLIVGIQMQLFRLIGAAKPTARS